MKPRVSLVGKYTVFSLALILGAVAGLSVLYAQFSDTLIERLTGERLNAQLAGTANRISAFIDNRIYQLETLSSHPAMPLYLTAEVRVPEGVEELVRVEADSPDLYGILFFDGDDRLANLVPGQAASGPPYWSRRGWSIAPLPRTRTGGTEIIGPHVPDSGAPGWLLIRQPLRGMQGGERRGHVALHVRLASITERIRIEDLSGATRTFLQLPDGRLLTPTGRPVSKAPPDLMQGPEVLPGWHIAYQIEAEHILNPVRTAQLGMYSLAGATGVGLVLVFWRLARSLRRRVNRLVDGADTLAAGDLQFRLRVHEDRWDEIDVVAHGFNAMADRLQQMLQRTIQSEKMAVLGEFATGVAHEVRNPLATIKLTVQALARKEHDQRRRELLVDVEQEIDRLNRVVGDLLTYGRATAGESACFEIRTAFRKATTVVEASARDKGVDISTSGDSRLCVYANAEQVVQCLVNLLANAVEACGEDDVIRLRAHEEHAQVRIDVTDNGRGMDAATLERVTDPFYTTREDGTGLGLSITRQLALLNGGSLELASEPGEGTTVTLRLPRCRTDEPAGKES
ncbi:HAMP domain-containing sensor histidine kinase [Aquisalimonas lutea]|uniref:sensor histidine kinase n=1 Tax=Aquisalimonas lutea TaxID=1327750 RepID=UPI0025B5EC43|nr:HAMP domain-containing sensor histidine kinase [Aquisalimonas lutea]MDN3517863.1 HAMP domain-containing sensor histidine kinase [Aquisalimonas lutea]